MKKIKKILITTVVFAGLVSCATITTKSNKDKETFAEPEIKKEETKTDENSKPKNNHKLITSYDDFYEQENIGIENLKFFQQGYEDINFEKKYDKKSKDWIVTVTIPKSGKSFKFYWANGRMLPEDQLKNKDKYWSILTFYPKELLDPKIFTDEIVDDILEMGSSNNRENGKGTPMFFFDAIYDSATQDATEKHIARLPFINRWINVHEDIEKPLNRVTEKMYAAAKTDKAVKDFINSIRVYEVYSWREITGTNRKSFHGLGIAIDALPKNLGKKQIFWNWTKRWNPKTWPTIPLSNRWMPPLKVIEIFESEGFAWGGKWALYDNMHFEYRPELLLYNNIN